MPLKTSGTAMVCAIEDVENVFGQKILTDLPFPWSNRDMLLERKEEVRFELKALIDDDYENLRSELQHKTLVLLHEMDIVDYEGYDSTHFICPLFAIEKCDGDSCFHFEDCLFKGHMRLELPYFVLDSYMAQLSGNQFKVFTYIARRCSFDPSHKNFGRTWISYAEIIKFTGVAQPRPCINKLLELKLIRLEQTRRPTGGSFATKNEFTVPCFYLLQDMKKYRASQEHA